MGIKARFGSSAEIGIAHHGFCFTDPGVPEEWVGVDFGLQPHDEVDDLGAKPDYSLPELISPLLKHLLVSHAHLDHVGGLPILFKRYKQEGKEMFTVYMSEISLQVAERLLWRPQINMADRNKRPRPFEPEDIKELIKFHIRKVRPGQMLDLGSCKVLSGNAGHIPGAFYWILIPNNGADPVFASGDLSFRKLGMMFPADPIPEKFQKFSLAVVESTYLGRDLPPRHVELARLRRFAKGVLRRKGTLVIPTFSIGLRGIEVGMDLEKNGIGPVYYAGMVKDAIRLYKELGVLPQSFSEKNFLSRQQIVESVTKHEPRVIIAPGGMAQESSTSWFCARDASDRKEDGIAFIGYQGNGTPGRLLFESKKHDLVQFSKTEKVRRECDIGKFQLSLHAGGRELEDLMRRLNAGTLVLNHGETDNIKGWIRQNSGRFPRSKMFCAKAGLEISLS